MRGFTRTAFVTVVLAVLGARHSHATIQYGPIQLSGNVESLNLLNVHQQFDMMPIMQRNTLRLQYEHAIAEGGKWFGGDFEIPGVDRVNLFAYYRFVYDSIYDLEPGGALKTQDGGFGGKFSDIDRGSRSDIAIENVMREIYVDVDTGPISWRIGRQQIVWGNALNFRALDTNNPLDLSWHL